MKQDGEVWGLRSALVRDAEDVAKLLRIANAKRTVRSHKLNNVSSRSHYLFRMSVLGRNAKTQQTSEGQLNLVDLAGCALRLLACRCTPPRHCVLLPPLPPLLPQRALTALAAHPLRSERLKKTCVSGEGQAEAININKSLTALSDVIAAMSENGTPGRSSNHDHPRCQPILPLALPRSGTNACPAMTVVWAHPKIGKRAPGKKKSHVPFRNSKLTHLLQASLSGTGS